MEFILTLYIWDHQISKNSFKSFSLFFFHLVHTAVRVTTWLSPACIETDPFKFPELPYWQYSETHFLYPCPSGFYRIWSYHICGGTNNSSFPGIEIRSPVLALPLTSCDLGPVTWPPWMYESNYMTFQQCDTFFKMSRMRWRNFSFPSRTKKGKKHSIFFSSSARSSLFLTWPFSQNMR